MNDVFMLFFEIFSETANTMYIAESIGGFIKEEYYSWVQYKSGPGGRPSMWKEYS